MRRALLIAFLYSITLVSLAQTIIEKAWTTSSSDEGLQRIDTRINDLVADLSKHHYRNEINKLSALFDKTHKRFLHTYVQYTGIEELVNGRYDCLTATSLFADILTRTGYKYSIIETNYHIFITVNTADGDVVLETTDRFGGFISDKDRVNEKLSEYRKNELNVEAGHQYSFDLFKTVDVDQLAGLLYINQAVKAFNAAKWDECSEKLSAAAQKTDSPHVAELTELLRRQPYFSGR